MSLLLRKTRHKGKNYISIDQESIKRDIHLFKYARIMKSSARDFMQNHISVVMKISTQIQTLTIFKKNRVKTRKQNMEEIPELPFVHSYLLLNPIP